MAVFRNLLHDQAAGRAVMAGRALLNLTQQDVGKAVGVTQTTVANIEKGLTSVKSETREAVLDYLGRRGVSFNIDQQNKLVSLALVYIR